MGVIGLGKSIILVVMIDYINIYKCEYIFIIEDLIEFVYDNKFSVLN